MTVNTYPNDIDDERSRRQIPAPLHTAFLLSARRILSSHRGDFLLTPDASESSISRIPTFLPRSSKDRRL